MKLFGIDFGIQYIEFEDEEQNYVISFKKSLFGNIKDVHFAKGNSETDIKVNSTRPNIFGRIRFLMKLLKRKVKKKFKH